MLNACLDRLAAEWPTAVDPDVELERSLAFLGIDVGATRLLAASYATATGLLACLPVVAIVVPPAIRSVALLLVLVAAVGVLFLARRGPRFLARVRRTRALGTAPTLVTFATLRMRLGPVPERAARFASDTVDGPLGDSLAAHVRRSEGGPGSGFGRFATEWRPWFPSLARGCSLLESAGTAQADRRSALLDRARSAVLEGTRERMASFGASVRGPVTGIYAFGVFLPLALVSLVPALTAAGVSTPTLLLVVVYDLLLPIALLAATAWLLARRPIAFPPPTITRDHPDVPNSPVRATAVGCCAGLAAWIVADRFLLPWTPPIAAVGIGLGTALVSVYRPLVTVRREIESVEADVDDALAMIGRRVGSGTSVELAVAAVAEASDGPIFDVLAGAAGRQRRLGIDLERALFGRAGVLRDLPSDRLHGAGAMLVVAARHGTTAGDAVVALAGHLGDLDAVERETRRSIEGVTTTLGNTAALFGPLVGGVTVSLASAMGGAGSFGGTADVGDLGVAVGIYVLALAVVLSVLTTGLSRGLDRSLAGYRAGIVLLCATATYLTAVAAGALVVQV